MSEDIANIVLIGGGLAAGKAAEALRAEGFDGRLTLVAEEAERPYERPPLSKGVLVGDDPAESVYVHADGFYAEHDIELLTGDAAVEIDRGAGTVTTVSGRELPFDRLLMATGAEPRHLPLTDASSTAS